MFWAQDFWTDGFWADDFWLGLTSQTGVGGGAGGRQTAANRGRWLPPGTGWHPPRIPLRTIAAEPRVLGSEVVEVSSAAVALAEVTRTVLIAAQGSVMVRACVWNQAEADAVWNPTEERLREILLSLQLS